MERDVDDVAFCGPRAYSKWVELDVTLHHAEVVALLAEVAPVRIHLTEGDEDRRWVELEPPSQVEFVPGEGVRVVTRGRLRHELAGVALPFDIRRLQILFAPRIVPGHHGQRLNFELRIEKVDLENVPGLVESVVVAKVNQALEPERLGLFWELTQTLTRGISVPERFEPLDQFLLSARSARVTVTHDSLVLRTSLGVAISRTSVRPVDGRPPSVA